MRIEKIWINRDRLRERYYGEVSVGNEKTTLEFSLTDAQVKELLRPLVGAIADSCNQAAADFKDQMFRALEAPKEGE